MKIHVVDFALEHGDVLLKNKMVFTPSEQYIKKEALDKEEQQDLKDNCNNFFERFVVNVLLETGIRVEEFVRLCTKKYMESQRDNEDFNKEFYNIINWQNNELTIYGKMPRQKKREKKVTKRKRRPVPISTTCKSYLEKYFTVEENQYIDYTTTGIWQIIKRVAKRADIKKDCSPHILRHTFAVNYLNNGGKLATLQRILGHASLQTTGIYLTMTSADIQKEFKEAMG